jgi:haloacetate dehalogenase
MLFDDRFTLATIDTGEARLAVRRGGEGPPLVLLHGFPQTHAMWHRVAPALARHFHLVMPDLRGYGDSAKPPTAADHRPYSKRAMARDVAGLMDSLGYGRYAVAGHDRGARVTHRLALDFPGRVERACVMDIVPTRHLFLHTDRVFATAYYHWFFLIQPDGLPERLIGADPGYYLGECLRRWAAPGAVFDPAALVEYQRCYREPATVHASCEDYRAGASIDLEDDAASAGQSIECPLLVLWGARGLMHRSWPVLDIWRAYAREARGRALDCGHFLPEEQPAAVVEELLGFLG